VLGILLSGGGSEGLCRPYGPPFALWQLRRLCKNKFSELFPSREAAKPQTKRLTWWSLT